MLQKLNLIIFLKNCQIDFVQYLFVWTVVLVILCWWMSFVTWRWISRTFFVRTNVLLNNYLVVIGFIPFRWSVLLVIIKLPLYLILDFLVIPLFQNSIPFLVLLQNLFQLFYLALPIIQQILQLFIFFLHLIDILQQRFFLIVQYLTLSLYFL